MSQPSLRRFIIELFKQTWFFQKGFMVDAEKPENKPLSELQLKLAC
jgi:hypothetical protein